MTVELRYLLDSTILIDHLNGILQATRWLAHLKDGEAAISVITRAEVLVRVGDEKQPTVELLDEYPCLSIDQQTADLAAELRNQWHWKLPDAFQAALTKQHTLVLVTRDKKDFGKAVRLSVKIPYHL